MSELQRVKHKLDKTLESLPDALSYASETLGSISAACADPRKLKGKGKGLSAGDKDDAVKSEGGDEESKDDDEENEENEDDEVEDEKVTKTHQPSHSMGHPQRGEETKSWKFSVSEDEPAKSHAEINAWLCRRGNLSLLFLNHVLQAIPQRHFLYFSFAFLMKYISWLPRNLDLRDTSSLKK
ncbi:hypothetical protein BD779DRAFT_1471218 [Infundibulicybe gibba]|nr:hypothetical protein BD779DRAFT_1471218 [Infundibulicybe gibba]